MIQETFALDGKRQEHIAQMIKKYIGLLSTDASRIPVAEAVYYLLGDFAEDEIEEMTDAFDQLAGFICRPDINALFMSFI